LSGGIETFSLHQHTCDPNPRRRKCDMSRKRKAISVKGYIDSGFAEPSHGFVTIRKLPLLAPGMAPPFANPMVRLLPNQLPPVSCVDGAVMRIHCVFGVWCWKASDPC